MADSTDVTFAKTESGVKAWQKVLKRKANEKLSTATDIGWLRPEDTRINMIGALDAPDKENIYKVKVLGGGKFSLTSRAGENLRVQLMDDHQRVLMDSKANMGQASKNFEAMTKDEFTLPTGTYYVKISRGDGVKDGTRINFAMQMLIGSGKYTNDYLTREVSPTKQDRVDAVLTPETVSATGPAATFLGDFAGTGVGGLLNPPSVGKILSVLA